MTDIDLDELERLARQATPRPWENEFNSGFKWIMLTQKHWIFEAKMLADGKYIVAACNAVPELIKMYRMADDEAADANSAWQKVRRENLTLREQVQELEKVGLVFVSCKDRMPTESGFYWVKDSHGRLHIIELEWRVQHWAGQKPKRYLGIAGEIMHSFDAYSESITAWAGPIPEPKEDRP